MHDRELGFQSIMNSGGVSSECESCFESLGTILALKVPTGGCQHGVALEEVCLHLSGRLVSFSTLRHKADQKIVLLLQVLLLNQKVCKLLVTNFTLKTIKLGLGRSHFGKYFLN